MGEEGQLEDKEIDGNLNNKTIIKIHPPQIRVVLEGSAPREIRRAPIGTRVCSVNLALESNTAIAGIQACQQLDGIGFRAVLKKDVGTAVHCCCCSLRSDSFRSFVTYFDETLSECRIAGDDVRAVLPTLCRHKWQLVDYANFWGGSFICCEAEKCD